jgi:hypothetical protein
VAHAEGLDLDVVILEDDALFNRVGINTPALVVGRLEPVNAVVDISAVSLEDMGRRCVRNA